MNETLVKICGVRSAEIAQAVSEHGADLMGLIFAPSKRQVTVSKAEEILAGGSERVMPRPKTVGVFVNESAERINQIANRLSLDMVQLSGDEPAELQQDISRPVIRALRLPAGLSDSDAYREAETYLDCSSPAWALLLDTHIAGAYGGTGVQGNWKLAEQLAARYPVILAGGLRPETVGTALDSVRPMGVDVSSGVETNGDKDPQKIRKFIEAARRHSPRRTIESTEAKTVRSRG